MREGISFEPEIYDYLQNQKKAIQTNLRDQDVNATGETSKSIYVVAFEDEGELLAYESLQSTETGSPEGTKVDMSALMEWVGIRINPDPSVLAAITNNIANKIMEDGTRLYQKGGRETIYTNVIENPKATSKLGSDISVKIANFVTNLFDNI